jgi:cytochrome c-type biogenesis protein CcmH/NrfF
MASLKKHPPLCGVKALHRPVSDGGSNPPISTKIITHLMYLMIFFLIKFISIFTLIFCLFFEILNADDLKNKEIRSSSQYEYGEISSDIKQRADYIFEILRCPTCQNIPLKESHSQIAENMKKLIIQKLAEGWREDQIINYFVQRYGDEILLQPKTKLFYIVPFIFLISSFVFLFFILIRKNKANKNSV